MKRILYISSTLSAMVLFLFIQSCKKNEDTSSVTPFKSDVVEVNAYTPSGLWELFSTYTIMINGAERTYFNSTLPDTLGFAVDTTNKFNTLDGKIVDTLWITKDYIPFPDTTKEGLYEVLVPIDKYNRGHIGQPLTFNLQILNTISDGGTLDISGVYKRGNVFLNIYKVAQGSFVLDNAATGSIPAAIFVRGASNTIEMPLTLTGSLTGARTDEQADVSVRHTQFYNIRYALFGSTPGPGDTLYYTSKRIGRAAATNRLIRQ